MLKIASNVLKRDDGSFFHTIIFNFEGRNFEAHVLETEEETYVEYCYQMNASGGGVEPIDIPKYFGRFASEVFDFIYKNIQRGYNY